MKDAKSHSDVQLKEMQILFDAGSLKAAEVFYVPSGITSAKEGWCILCWGKERHAYYLRSQREADGWRTFKTVDAAVKALHAMGWRTFSIDTNLWK